VDVLIFNPPYVPTDQDELGRSDIVAAWAGGEDGREVIDAFLPLVPRFLSPGGVLYLHLIAENNPSDVSRRLHELGVPLEKLLVKRRAQNELLHVLKYRKPIK